MLDIILQILPVLGFIILILLCIVIAFLLLVLFFPVSYKISGKKDDKAFSLSAGADWLFGLLRVRYAYPKPGRLTVKLLWIKLYDMGIGIVEHEGRKADKEKATGKERSDDKEKATGKERSDDKEKAAGKERAVDKEKATAKEGAAGKEKVISIEKATDKEKTTVNKEKAADIERAKDKTNEKAEVVLESQPEGHSDTFGQMAEGNTEESTENHEGVDEQGSNWITEKIEKIKFTICNAYDKIKKIWENISYYVLLLQEEETHLLFSHAMKRLGRVFKNIRPRKLRVNVLFGTGAPDTTGYAFGVYCMISPVLGPGVIVTPDFERAVLEGDFDVTGYVTSVVLVWQFLRVILDKKLWRFIDKLKKGREPADTLVTETKEENTKQDKDNSNGKKENTEVTHKK